MSLNNPAGSEIQPSHTPKSRREFFQLVIAGSVGAIIDPTYAKTHPSHEVNVRKTGEINRVRALSIDPTGKNREKFRLGKVVRQEQVDSKSRPIASITKLMTALVVYDICRERNIDIQKVKILLDSDDKIRAKSKNGRVPSGKKYTIEELLDMALIKSTNEAAEALATGIIPREHFISRMNQKAKSLQMNGTKFDNPSGIFPNNTSTVDDLEKLTIAILNSPYPIGKTTQYESVEISHVRRDLGSANRITLARIRSLGADPLLTKTGFIRSAGRCEITVFRVPSGNTYLLTLLGADTDKERKRAVWKTVEDLVKRG